MSFNNDFRFTRGFTPATNSLVWGLTLVELLVVVTLIGMLAAFITSGFQASQRRGRDVTRKNDLRQLTEALELFYADYGSYPADDSGEIAACPYNPGTQTGGACAWGSDQLTDGSTMYIKKVPGDSTNGRTYFYRIVPGSSNQKYQLFARLESPQDPDCIDDGSGPNCTDPVAHSCGTSGVCNFAITSPNSEALE